MDRSEIILTIIEAKDCPLYQKGDQFQRKGRILVLPRGKSACITFASDIQEVREEAEFGCSGPATGCVGAIRVRAQAPEAKPQKPRPDGAAATAKEMVNLLKSFPMFQALDEAELEEVISWLKLKKFPKDGIVLQKSEPGIRLYIIVSGSVSVLEEESCGEVVIANLKKGEVFGEMSLLSGEEVGATVKAAEPSWLLYIKGQDFRRLLDRFPPLQNYFMCLLAQRLKNSNIQRAQDLSALRGRLTDVPATELFQTLNQNLKTGLLHLDLPEGKGEFSFREGDLIRAQYGDLSGKDAFFQALKAREGTFRFSPKLPDHDQNLPEIGDFIWLLMEGLNRIDEGR